MLCPLNLTADGMTSVKWWVVVVGGGGSFMVVRFIRTNVGLTDWDGWGSVLTLGWGGMLRRPHSRGDMCREQLGESASTSESISLKRNSHSSLRCPVT